MNPQNDDMQYLLDALKEAEAGLEFAGADKEPERQFVPAPTQALRIVREALAKYENQPPEWVMVRYINEGATLIIEGRGSGIAIETTAENQDLCDTLQSAAMGHGLSRDMYKHDLRTVFHALKSKTLGEIELGGYDKGALSLMAEMEARHAYLVPANV